MCFKKKKVNDSAKELSGTDEVRYSKPKVRKVGSYDVPKNHRVFKIDPLTEKITEVEMTVIKEKDENGTERVRKSCTFEPGMAYIHALNMENAKRRLEQGKFLIPKPYTNEELRKNFTDSAARLFGWARAVRAYRKKGNIQTEGRYDD